jgi:hypothetical protein
VIRSRFRTVAVLGITAAFLLGGTSIAAASTARVDPAPAAAAGPIAADGTFTVSLFPPFVTRDIGRHKCELRVQGELNFTGTLVGIAKGTTIALIDAPCIQAVSQPPGTFSDRFRFDGHYTGSVDRVDGICGKLSYAGTTHPGGAIDATIKLRAGGTLATLRTEGAELGVGGRYHGTAITN